MLGQLSEILHTLSAAPTSLSLSHNSLAASSHLLMAATPSKCWSQSEKDPFPEKDSGVSKGRVVIVTNLYVNEMSPTKPLR